MTVMPINIIELLPTEFKKEVLNSIVDVVSEQARKFVGQTVADKIYKLHSDAAFMASFELALQEASARFVKEYEIEDEDLVRVLAREQTLLLADKSFQTSLLKIIKNPGKYYSAETLTVATTFDTLLPDRKNRERVNKAVNYFIKCLVEEIWNLPELRQVYSFHFQRLTAEASLQQLEVQRNLLQSQNAQSAEIRAALIELSAAINSAKQVPLLTDVNVKQQGVIHNLPQPDYEKFIGREKELDLLIEKLRPIPYSRQWAITIDGVGGVGKTALTLEAANRYVGKHDTLPENERFDAIIWTSAKQFYLTALGIQERLGFSRNLSGIFTDIALTLDRRDILKESDLERQVVLVKNALSQQRVLLIIDNLETIDDEFVTGFIRELPWPTKVIVTTRHRIDVAYALRLSRMSKEESLELVNTECRVKNVKLTEEQFDKLYSYTGGIPLALILSIGRMSLGYEIDSVLNWLSYPSGDVAVYCFEASIQEVNSEPNAIKVLVTISFLPKSVSRSMIGKVINDGTNIIERDNYLAQLEQLSLINKSYDRFSMLPLTKEYVLKKFTTQEIEREILLRIGRYYFETFLDFSRRPKWESYDYIDEERENIQFALLKFISTIHDDIDWLSTEENKLFLITSENFVTYLLSRGHWNEFEVITIGIIEALENTDKVVDLIRLVNCLGRLHWQRREISPLSNLENSANKAMSIAMKSGKTVDLAVAKHLLGLFELGNNNLDEAKKYLEESVKLSENEIGLMGKQVKREDLSRVLIELADYKSAELQLKEALKYSVSMDDLEGQSIDLYYLGVLYERQNDFITALKYFKDSMLLAEKVGRSTTIAKCQFAIARLFKLQGLLTEALEMSQSALASYNRLGLLPKMHEVQGFINSLL